MSNDIIALEAAVRTEFGKGASRRARVAGQVPAVIYGKGFDPKHILVDRLAFTAVVRRHGVNAVLNLDIEGEKQLAMIKSVDQNVLTLEIDHADLLAIHRGETVEVDVHVTHEGTPAPGATVMQDAETIKVSADVLSIPEHITVSVEGAEAGTQITAGEIALPEGVTLVDEADVLVFNVVAGAAGEAADEEEAAEGEEAAAE